MNLWDKLCEKLDPAQRLLIERAAGAAEELKMPVYIVGGVVRDLLLDRPVMDLDIVAEGDAICLGKALAAAYGGKLTLHPQFFTAKWYTEDGLSPDLISARSETYDAPGVLPKVYPGSMDDDLRRRDFTVNTLAVRLDGPSRGEVLDLCGGMADMRDRLIRTLHERSFIDDPTRIFRAVRFEQRFGFTLEEDTLRQLRGQLDGISGLTGQRIWHELKLYCSEPCPEKDFSRIAALGVAARINSGLIWTEAMEADCIRFRTAEPEVYWHQTDPAETDTAAAEGSLWTWLSAHSSSVIGELSGRLLLSKKTVLGIEQTAKLRAELPAYRVKKPSETAFFLDSISLSALYCYVRFCPSAEDKEMIRSYVNEARRTVPELSGDDLRNLGIEPGPRMRELLQSLRAGRIDGMLRSKDDEILWLRQEERKDL